MELIKRKCRDVSTNHQQPTKRVKGKANKKVTKSRTKKNNGRSLDCYSSDAKANHKGLHNKSKKLISNEEKAKKYTVDSDETSSGSDLEKEFEIEAKTSSRNNRQTKKKVSKNSDHRSASVRDSEATYDSSLIPSTNTQSKDSNNRRIIHLDGSGEGIEDIKNLKFPEFIKRENIRDKNMKRPDEEGYDPSSIHIPETDFKKLTPGMQQYWTIKKDHFDSVVMTRFGRWFFIYFHDLIALNKVSEKPINLNYQLHGFPQTQKENYIEAFVKAGYKVVVVEQTETTEMMIKRIENQEEIKTKTHFIVDREIYGIYTKGTYQKPIKNKLDEVYDPENYLDNKNVFVYVHDQETNDFGFTYFDVSTLKCVVGQFSDDSMLTKFQTLIATVQPVEVVCSSKLKKTDMTKILFQASSKPSFSFIKADKLLSLKDSKIIIEHYFGGKHKSCPKVVSNIIEDYNKSKHAVIAFGQMIKYLEDLLIADKTVTFLEISHFDHFYGAESNKNKREYMVLDKAALDHLQIFEVDDYTKAVEGSLFHMFKCSFIFGRRLLRKWFAAPLCNKEKLKQRHDAVEYLVNNYKLVQRFRKEMKITYDLEQCLQAIYKFCVMSESRAVYVNINLANQLNYFHILLDQFEKIIGKLNKIFPDKSIIKAKRLRNLLSFNTKDTKNFEAKSKKSSNRFTMTSENDEEEIKCEIDFDRSDNHGILPDIICSANFIFANWRNYRYLSLNQQPICCCDKRKSSN